MNCFMYRYIKARTSSLFFLRVVLFFALTLHVGLTYSMSIPLINKKERVTLFSPISGHLIKDGKPLVDTKMRVILEYNKQEKIFDFQSDSQGYFALPIQEDRMLVSPFSQFVVGQYIEVIIEGNWLEIWGMSKMDPSLYYELGGEVIGLICDVSHKSSHIENIRGSLFTSCKWKKIRKV